VNDVRKPWGRWATLGLAVVALLVSQMAGLVALTVFYGAPLGRLPDFSGDGVAISLIIFVSTPIEVGLLIWFAQRRGASWADYLGYTLPRKADVVFGVAAIVGLIVLSNLVSWFLGRTIVTPFQLNIYRTAAASGWMPLLWLWLGVVVATPIGEESLFRGFLFRGWLTGPRDAWPVIIVTAALWAVIHVQYDWYVIAQVFGFGVMLGWLRWASGSTLLTMLLHAVINFEGMLETTIDLKWFT
jgi:hypothetical protein